MLNLADSFEASGGWNLEDRFAAWALKQKWRQVLPAQGFPLTVPHAHPNPGRETYINLEVMLPHDILHQLWQTDMMHLVCGTPQDRSTKKAFQAFPYNSAQDLRSFWHLNAELATDVCATWLDVACLETVLLHDFASSSSHPRFHPQSTLCRFGYMGMALKVQAPECFRIPCLYAYTLYFGRCCARAQQLRAFEPSSGCRGAKLHNGQSTAAAWPCFRIQACDLAGVIAMKDPGHIADPNRLAQTPAHTRPPTHTHPPTHPPTPPATHTNTHARTRTRTLSPARPHAHPPTHTPTPTLPPPTHPARHTHTQTHTHTHLRAHAPTCPRAHANTRPHAHTPPCPPTPHAPTRTRTRTPARPHARARTHARAHTRTSARRRTHTHTHRVGELAAVYARAQLIRCVCPLRAHGHQCKNMTLATHASCAPVSLPCSYRLCVWSSWHVPQAVLELQSVAA